MFVYAYACACACACAFARALACVVLGWGGERETHLGKEEHIWAYRFL